MVDDARRARRLQVVSDAMGEDVADPLPARHELDLRRRLLVEGAAAFDVGLRTFVSTLLVGAAAPLALSKRALREDGDALPFYAELADAADAERSFPAPPDDIEVHARAVARLARPRRRGRVEALRFESPFQARNPAVRTAYAGHRHNRIARAQHWRHHDGPRPTLVVIHGFMGSPAVFNSAFFSLPWFYAQGYDVLLYTLPFHGRRSSSGAPFSGTELFAHGMATFHEAMAHAVHDLRAFLDHLERQGVAQIGLTGLSLGGYTTALMAAVEPRLRVAVPNAPVTHLPDVVRLWFPFGALLERLLDRWGIDVDTFERSLASHSPLTYEPVVPFDRRLIIAGLGDRLAPPEQSEALWEHWDRCALHWFPGNHVVHVNRVRYNDCDAALLRHRRVHPDGGLTPAGLPADPQTRSRGSATAPSCTSWRRVRARKLAMLERDTEPAGS